MDDNFFKCSVCCDTLLCPTLDIYSCVSLVYNLKILPLQGVNLIPVYAGVQPGGI